MSENIKYKRMRSGRGIEVQNVVSGRGSPDSAMNALASFQSKRGIVSQKYTYDNDSDLGSNISDMDESGTARTFDTAGFGGNIGFGGGNFNFAGIGLGETESPSVPDEVMNLLVSYKVTEKVGITAALQVTSPFVLGYENGFNFAESGDEFLESIGGPGPMLSTSEVGWQHNLDLGIFYETEMGKIRLNILNATDETNFGGVNPVYGNASVFLELPRRYEVSFEKTF